MQNFDAIDAASTAKAFRDDLIDLTTQQRNLLLMRPLFQLELQKNRFSNEEGDGEGLFEGIDTHYLSLCALTYMMEGTAVALGYTAPEVQAQLARIVVQMRPVLSASQCIRIADVVLDALLNASNNYQEFSFSFFHAPSRETRMLRFRLISLEADLEDTYRYRPTNEGYLVLMGMLDLQVEDHQILIERMLQLLIERGRFDQAYEFARRARMLSIEHRQQLREFITQAWRAPGTVLWARDIGPRLNTAREHVRARQEEDRRMEESVRDQLLQVENINTREQIIRLHDVLRSASTIRAQLQLDVTEAGDKFMNSQTSAFRARRASGLPDLEMDLLPSTLECAATALDEAAEELVLSLYPGHVPKTPDLSDLLALLLERRAIAPDPEDEEDSGVIEPFKYYPDPFSQEVVARVHTWLNEKLVAGSEWLLDELVALAVHDGFSALEQQCVAYALYRSYPDIESPFPIMHAEAEGVFTAAVVQGDNLRFTTKEAP
jgi:hypothetical protein